MDAWLDTASITGDESSPHIGDLPQTELLEKVLKGQVFTKRDQMDLVVDRQDRAVVINDVNRIVGARDGRIRDALGRAHRSGDQHGAGRQECRDLGKGFGVACQKERERGFRPDQVGDVVDAG